jgi:hypothetical protein
LPSIPLLRPAVFQRYGGPMYLKNHWPLVPEKFQDRSPASGPISLKKSWPHVPEKCVSTWPLVPGN